MKGRKEGRTAAKWKMAFAVVAVIGAVALAMLALKPPQATASFSWNSFADAVKAESLEPASVEVTAYQASTSGSYGYDNYWNNGYFSTSQPLSYNPSEGVALVKEIRSVDLSKGAMSLSLKGTSAHIDPTSISLREKTDNAVSVLEQNYDYDLVSGQKLLEKYVDSEISVRSGNRSATGVLLSPSGPVLKTANGVTVFSGYDSLDFPTLPAGFVTTPTINWLLNSQVSGKRDIEVSYLTSGINWNADYVAIDNEEDTQLSLQGWVSLRNDAGVTFKDAKLKLVAGEVNYATRTTNAKVYADSAMGMAYPTAAPQFTENSFFEYHMYTLNRPTTVASGQVKQVEMTSAQSVKVDKKYVFESSVSDKVQVKLAFNNTEANGLGIPLPKGKVRVYKADADGQLQFAGEDSIDHTAKDEPVKLLVGNAFDVVATRTQTDTESVGSCGSRNSYKIELRNHKTSDVKVSVVEYAYGEWDVKNENYPHSKDSSTALSWEIPVKADGTAALEYTITSRWC